MTYEHTLHIEAPVRAVFEFFRDPGNWTGLDPDGVEFRDIVVTREGLGTHYTWRAKLLGLRLRGPERVHGVRPEPAHHRPVVERARRHLALPIRA